MVYDCIVIGGGIAGLQASIQLGRYQHQVLVVDANRGRSTLCRSYHNLLGWPDGVSGDYLRKVGRKQAESFGTEFVTDEVTIIQKTESDFEIKSKRGNTWKAKSLLLATGVSDRIPSELLPKLIPCLGLRVYVCPDCDGIETKNHRTIVMGSGSTGANLALDLTYWCQDVVYINHEKAKIEESTINKLKENKIEYYEMAIINVLVENEWEFKGVTLENEMTVHADRGFIAFGGNEVHSSLVKQLGVERMENRHIIVDPRTKKTNVPMVWAAGDVTVHSEQVAIAMGDGLQAAIWIHKSLCT